MDIIEKSRGREGKNCLPGNFSDDKTKYESRVA